MGDVDMQFLDRTHRLEPGPLQRHLVDHDPVHRVDDHDPPFYVVSRQADVADALRDVGTWRSAEGPGVEYTPGGVLGSTDRPDHTRQRRVVAPAFTPAAMAALEPRVAALADRLFDAFVPLGRGDFVPLFAGPLPAIVIADLLGVPPEDRDTFRRWSDDIVVGLGGENLEQGERTRHEMAHYLLARIDERVAALAAVGRPLGEAALGDVVPDDLLARLAVAHHDEQLLTRPEMVSLALQILVAGHETTTSLLGLLVYRLIEHPDVLARVRADRRLVVPLIEELLRFDSPVQGLFRTNEHDVTLHGATIPAGTKVNLLFAAANRDPARWDHPDVFDIDRPWGQLSHHMAFGYGIHFCLGAPLARLEARLSLHRLLDRMDDLRLEGEPQVIRPFILRGFSSLPISWTAR